MPDLEEGSLSGIYSTVQLGSPPHYIKMGGRAVTTPLHVCFENIYMFDGSQAMDDEGKTFYLAFYTAIFFQP